VARICIRMGSIWRLLCKRRPRLFQLDIDPVFRCVFTSAATALRLLPWNGAPTGEMGASHATHRGRVCAVSLRVTETLAALAFQRGFGATYDSIETRRPQSSVTDSTLDTSGPLATETMTWGVGGRSLVGSWSRRPESGCVSPWT